MKADQPSAGDTGLEHYHDRIDEQINRIMRIAGIIISSMGFLCGLSILVMLQAGLIHDLMIPAVWALSGGFFGLLIFLLASVGWIRGRRQYVIMLLLVFMPTVLFVGAELALPSGAATYLSGPGSYLYFFLLIVTGFMLNYRLSLLAGVLACGLYSLFIVLSIDHLAALQHPDPLLQQDFQNPPIYFFKALMMAFSGWLVGSFARFNRRLVERIVNESREKEHIQKLFGQFVSEEIKDKIIQSKMDVLGEKKEVAVLFCDIRGFTAYAEKSGPELTVRQLNRYFERMIAAISEQGGVVDKFIGDAVMAVFGGIIELDSACDRAVTAAVGMQNELAVLNKNWAAEGYESFKIGIGIHYGEVIQGTLGSAERKEFTVIGDTVNTASRLEAVTTKVGRSLVFSAAVADRLQMGGAEKVGLVNVKGKEKPVEVWGLAEGCMIGSQTGKQQD